MKTQNPLVVSLCLLLCSFTAAVHAQAPPAAAAKWVEGRHYFLIQPAQPTNAAAGKVEVTECFSYGCPACFNFYPTADKLKASLPKNAQMVYLPASFLSNEDWPMFQRAFYTAQALGLVERTHNAMFDAVSKTYELGVVDPKTNRLRSPLPSIEDAAKFYNRLTGVKPETFVATSKSFSVDANMKRADVLMKAYKVDSTPTIVVNGKYRLTVSSAGGTEELIALVNYLVAKESK